MILFLFTVRVHAASVNPLDLAMSRGYGQVLLSMANMATSIGIDRLHYDRLPLTLGRDFVGEVISVGHSVVRFKPGDLVWGIVPPYYDGGSHSDHLITPEGSVWYKPKNLSAVEAASLPYVALTAWSALVNFGQISCKLFWK